MAILIIRIVLCIGGVCCLLCILRGVGLIQRAGGGELLRCKAVVRQVRQDGRSGVKTLLTLTIEEAVLHVDCDLPGQWFHRVRVRPTDVLTVLWRPGDTYAVAESTIRHGQVMFTAGMVVLALLTAAGMQVF